MGFFPYSDIWKRTDNGDLKFDHVDVDEFRKTSFWMRIKYIFVFLAVFKYVLTYLADVWVAVILFVPSIVEEAGTGTAAGVNSIKQEDGFWPAVRFRKYLMLASIIVSFLILGWEIFKAKKIIDSRDISLAYTCKIAYLYYVIKSYNHFSFFTEISSLHNRTDKVAFFVFFRLNRKPFKKCSQG
jgi:hypothetical protein